METANKVRFTTQDFHRMGEVSLLSPLRKHELLGGEMFKMAPESHQHAFRTADVAEFLRDRVRRLGLRPVQYVREGHPVTVSDFDEPVPDVVLLRHPVQETPRPDDLHLIIEISRTTQQIDRAMTNLAANHEVSDRGTVCFPNGASGYATSKRIKRERYGTAGVPEYWIIDLVGDVLEVYHAGLAGGYGNPTCYERGAVIRVAGWGALGEMAVANLLG